MRRACAVLFVCVACTSTGDPPDAGEAAGTSRTSSGTGDDTGGDAPTGTTTAGPPATTGPEPTTSGPEATGEPETDTDADTGTDTDDPPGPDLETAVGCPGVYNVDQILDLSLDMAPGDWETVKGDLGFSIYVPAQFRCGDEAPLTVGVRRKRSGGSEKVGLKVDFNELVIGQRWQGLRKLSLENGVSSGNTDDDAEVRDLVAEYLGWRIMQRSGAVAGRAAFANLHVNGEWIGVYVDVEQVDKTFLKDRFGDDDGWLVKKSGGDGDGPQTHEDDGLEDPYAAFLCFWENGGQACEVPPDDVLLAELPQHLDIPQLLRFGAANAYIANTDGPLFKDNNWYYYDWAGGGRAYLPTDLDTTMKVFTDVLTPNGHAFDTVLFTHWRPDYEAMLAELVEDQAPATVVLAELARVVDVAGPSLDADPWTAGTADEATQALGEWWTMRDADVRAQLGL